MTSLDQMTKIFETMEIQFFQIDKVAGFVWLVHAEDSSR